jgi:hypothetical protein
MRALPIALTGLLALAAAAAKGEELPGPEFKLTLGRYASSDGNPALDANLRGSSGPHTAWLGVYRDRAGLQQWRSGLERRLESEGLRGLLSLQNASGGAWVGAVSAEIGGATYAIAGWGRTNVRNYINLNYDPNDAITLGLGSRAFPGTELSLFQVRDDRLHTGQQVTHFVLRQRFEDEQRLTVDLFTKRGNTPEGEWVNSRSWSLGYDRGALFARFTHDPHAGFTLPTQNRISFGCRF